MMCIEVDDHLCTLLKNLDTLKIAGFVTGFLLAPVCVLAQELPSPEKVLADMTLANQYFMDKWLDPTVNIVTDRSRPSNIWTRAAYYEGLMALFFLAFGYFYWLEEKTLTVPGPAPRT